MAPLTPYGTWISPISATQVGRRTRLEEVCWSSEGALLWLEGRPNGNAIIARLPEDAPVDLTGETPACGLVGYGGGEFTVQGNLVIFAGSDGRLYRRRIGYDCPRPITPPFGAAASPQVSPDGNWVLYVFSDSINDRLALVDSAGRDWPLQHARSADFFMQPVWHPSGEWIAWVEWDHPNMPWDGTRLKLGRLAGEIPRPVEEILLAGDERTPVCQPLFSPDGRWLSYITANGEWEKLQIHDMETGRTHTLVEGEGLLLSTPAWVQGMRFYGWSRDSRRLFYLTNSAGRSELWVVELEKKQRLQIDTVPYTWLSQIAVSPLDDQVAFIASSPSIPNRVVRWNGNRLCVEHHSEAEEIDPLYLPTPQPITWSTPDGVTVHGLFSSPCNPAFKAPGLPPAIVNIHSGPTSQALLRYNPEAAYFTSRGYAWMDVNYRGSSGYGRRYQQALNGKWGILDVEDAAGAAKTLVDQKLADAKKLVIRGSSAGGFTVLNTLIRFPALFKAGICLYGISNLFGLAMDTHKFEAHYHDTLVGKLSEAADQYQARSPLFHAERIRDPLLIFQGNEDRVVPPSQAEEIVTALRQLSVPHQYILYEGEGHGFRKGETIQDYLNKTERFLQQYVLFAP